MSKFFSPKMPEPPPKPKVARMPTPMDPSVEEAKKRVAGVMKNRAGRASTILTQAAGSGTKLGA